MTAILSLEEEIATFLGAQSLSTALVYAPDSTGSNLFVSLMPDLPDVAVSVIARGGIGPLVTLTGGGAAESLFDKPTTQIRVRTGISGYDEGQALAQSIYGVLQGICETVLNPPDGQLFHLILAIQSPTYLGRDERERHGWSQNFQTWFDNEARQS